MFYFYYNKFFEKTQIIVDLIDYYWYIVSIVTINFRRNFYMTKITINLATINDVKQFVNIVARYDFDVDLVSGRYAIDAKSIMGIFSLDLTKPLNVELHTDDDAAILTDLKQFIV